MELFLVKSIYIYIHTLKINLFSFFTTIFYNEDGSIIYLETNSRWEEKTVAGRAFLSVAAKTLSKWVDRFVSDQYAVLWAQELTSPF